VLRSATLEGIEDGYRLHTDLVPTMDHPADRPRHRRRAGHRPGDGGRAGLDMARGRVRADEHMRTSAPGVLAAGDVALAYNVSAQRAHSVEHWGEALTMGEIAGRTAAGAVSGGL
jgi:NADPH-dependent 2,4-dienoyl-CoA reductase/sulfur reductase-like enzyme